MTGFEDDYRTEVLSLGAVFDARKKFFRIKLDRDCVLRMKLSAGSVQTQKSLITMCKGSLKKRSLFFA